MKAEHKTNNEPRWCSHCNTKSAYKELASGGYFGASLVYICLKCNKRNRSRQ